MIKKLEELCKQSPLYSDAHLTLLNKELEIIAKHHYEKQFLQTLELIKHANALAIPIGPGNLSTGCSVVNYLLGITFIDPLQFNLDSEEFLSIGYDATLYFSFDVSAKKIELLNQYVGDNIEKFANAYDVLFPAPYLDLIQDYFKEPLSQLYDFSSYVWKQQSSVMKFLQDLDNYEGIYCFEHNPLAKQILQQIKPQSLAELADAISHIRKINRPKSDAISSAILAYLGSYVLMNENSLNSTQKRLLKYHEKFLNH